MKNKRGCSLAGIARLALLACVTFNIFIIHENAMLVWKKQQQQNKTNFIRTFKPECCSRNPSCRLVGFLGLEIQESQTHRYCNLKRHQDPRLR